ncbi:hypothetical protein C8R44DRAFT_588 [Mycena epipterygia]|nr:hypothetical protein C8R44DRAFT_588 [Mycena epipterygia]
MSEIFVLPGRFRTRRAGAEAGICTSTTALGNHRLRQATIACTNCRRLKITCVTTEDAPVVSCQMCTYVATNEELFALTLPSTSTSGLTVRSPLPLPYAPLAPYAPDLSDDGLDYSLSAPQPPLRRTYPTGPPERLHQIPVRSLQTSLSTASSLMRSPPGFARNPIPSIPIEFDPVPGVLQFCGLLYIIAGQSGHDPYKSSPGRLLIFT